MNAGERMMRAGVGMVGAAGWWLLMAWVGGLMHAWWIVKAGAVVWGVFLVCMVALVLGAKRSGPEDGMGRGCLWIVIWITAGVIGVLGLCELLGFWVWANGIALGALFVAFMLLVQMVWFARRKAKMKRLAREAAATVE